MGTKNSSFTEEQVSRNLRIMFGSNEFTIPQVIRFLCLKSDHVRILPSRDWVWCSLPQWSNQPDQYSVTISGKSSLSASTLSKSWCPWLMSWKLTVGSASVKHERSVYNRLWQPMTAEWQDLSRCIHHYKSEIFWIISVLRGWDRIMSYRLCS